MKTSFQIRLQRRFAMAILQFSKFAPGGNDTVFLHSPPPFDAPELGAQALAMLGGEQAGFVDPENRTLFMAGGEFCVNATRAFGALLDLAMPDRHSDAIRRHMVRVSGWNDPVVLSVRGAMPLWQISAQLTLPPCPVEAIDTRHSLVRLPGISHLLYESGPLADLVSNAEHMRAAFGLQDEAALGIIAYNAVIPGKSYTIVPYVIVPSVGTAMIESCCGSASLALGLALFLAGIKGPLKIGQPKSVLEVSLERDGNGQIVATIGGPVAFLLQGIMNTEIYDFLADHEQFQS